MLDALGELRGSDRVEGSLGNDLVSFKDACCPESPSIPSIALSQSIRLSPEEATSDFEKVVGAEG